jgi:hypothetical protein
VRPAAPLICRFIDEHKEQFGVAPVCRALTVHGIQIAPRTYWARLASAPSKRALWDAAITEILAGIYQPDEKGRRPPEALYGTVKMWGRFGYTAFVIDAFAGLIPAWECSLSKQTAFVEAAIRQAAAYRARQGHPFTGKGIHHSDAGSRLREDHCDLSPRRNPVAPGGRRRGEGARSGRIHGPPRPATPTLACVGQGPRGLTGQAGATWAASDGGRDPARRAAC